MIELQEYWDVDYEITPVHHPKYDRRIKIIIKNHSPHKRRFRVKVKGYSLQDHQNILHLMLYGGINAPIVVEVDRYRKGFAEFDIPRLVAPEKEFIIQFQIENLDKGEVKTIEVKLI